MWALLAEAPDRDQYGDALSSLHGLYAQAEAAVLYYLRHDRTLFDYRSRRKLPALESDLAVLGRLPMPMYRRCPDITGIGALFGTLYTLEGSTLGGQFIAQRLRRTATAILPMRFYTIYGEATRQRWEQFLHCADSCCPASEHERAADTAAGLFLTLLKHLDDCQTRIAANQLRSGIQASHGVLASRRSIRSIVG